jgi:hypothetical protein
MLLSNRNMDAFSDDIFCVFDESAEGRTPIAKSDEKQPIQELKIQPDVK